MYGYGGQGPPPELNEDIARDQSALVGIRSQASIVKLPATGFVATVNGLDGNVTVAGGQGLSASAGGGTVTVQIEQTAWSTYTPTLTPQAGALTTSSASGFYKVLGKTVHIRILITITNVGTATGHLNASLPVNAKDTSFSLAGVDSAINKALAVAGKTVSTVRIDLYDGTTDLVNGANMVIAGVYESA